MDQYQKQPTVDTWQRIMLEQESMQLSTGLSGQHTTYECWSLYLLPICKPQTPIISSVAADRRMQNAFLTVGTDQILGKRLPMVYISWQETVTLFVFLNCVCVPSGKVGLINCHFISIKCTEMLVYYSLVLRLPCFRTQIWQGEETHEHDVIGKGLEHIQCSAHFSALVCMHQGFNKLLQ